MVAETVLLLDLGTPARVGERLLEILSPAMDEGVRLIRQPICSYDSELRDAEVRNLLARVSADLLVLVLPDIPASELRSLFPLLAIPTIVASESCEPRQMLELLELGACDFIGMPLNARNILPRMWRLLQHSRRKIDLRTSLKHKLGLKHLVGESAAFVEEVNKVPIVANCDATVLILGETGTGKELFARAIHYLGPRASKPFVPVNCGAIPADLVENELFGHERGAYTGASAAQAGLVAEADGGTLFLDEIDCLPLMAQVKLLRFIQEREYRALGSTRTQRVDLRIVAASNCDLIKAVEDGKVRRDLYYRLNILPFNLPPLRERLEDVPLLAGRFISKFAAEVDKHFTGFSAEAMQALVSYDWPGNVRELEHVIERAAVLASGPLVLERDLAIPHSDSASRWSFQEAKARLIDQFEKSYIRSLLLAHRGNITRAAQAAGKNRRAFFELIRKHHIDVQSFKARAGA
jgi:DNA-binding NtrC family response regulator